jgi:hypothetical protein
MGFFASLYYSARSSDSDSIPVGHDLKMALGLVPCCPTPGGRTARLGLPNISPLAAREETIGGDTTLGRRNAKSLISE